MLRGAPAKPNDVITFLSTPVRHDEAVKSLCPTQSLPWASSPMVRKLATESGVRSECGELMVAVPHSDRTNVAPFFHAFLIRGCANGMPIIGYCLPAGLISFAMSQG